MAGPVYALNLFNVADRDEYLAYSRRSVKEVQAHGGRVVALGKFCEAAAGDIKPRSVMILVEWASKRLLTATATIQKSSTCMRTGRRVSATTSGTSSISSRTCGRSSNNNQCWSPAHCCEPSIIYSYAQFFAVDVRI